MKPRIVFFGTPGFAADILDYLIKNKANIVAVVTKPDKPQKRSKTPKPPPVKQLALEKIPDVPLFQPKKASALEFAEILASFNPDIFVVAAYSEIFKENLLQMPKLACINVHASILPKYRGAAPIARAIMAGEKETGITIMSMAKELDAGAMLKIVKTPIDEELTAGDLTIKLAGIGAEALLEVLVAFEKGVVHPEEQDSSEATYAPKLTDEDGLIDWQKDATPLHNQIRGANPNPGAFCYVLHKGVKKRFLIARSKVEKISGQPGGVLPSSKETLIIACGVDALNLLEIQLEGKKRMHASEFLRGISKKELSFLI